MTTAADITKALRAGLGESFGVRVRRPGAIFQIEVPSYLGDGDAAMIFVRARQDGRLDLTDLGHIRMRLSYKRELSERTDSELAMLAHRHGLDVIEGEVRATVVIDELLPGTFGLLQVEAEAEAAIGAMVRRQERAESFKSMVASALKEAFNGRCTIGYNDPRMDPDALYPVDALISGPVSLGVSIVPTDMEAERAVGVKLKLDSVLHGKHRWIAIPRDIDALASKTRKRLMQEHLVPIPVFAEEQAKLRQKLDDLSGDAEISA